MAPNKITAFPDATTTLKGKVKLAGDLAGTADAPLVGNDKVTYAKMQNVSATDKVLGRSTAGSGDVEEIACTSAGRALLDDANAAAQRVTLGVRDVLTGTRNYYVRTDGNDSNDGLANNSSHAFLTISQAINVCSTLDLSALSVYINVADGTYTNALVVNGNWLGTGNVLIQGNTTTPANCIISITNDNAIQVTNSGRLWIAGFKITTSGSGSGLVASNKGSITVYGSMDFGACAWYHMQALQGGIISNWQNYTISGSTGAHYEAESFGHISSVGNTITLTGTPNFSSGFAYASRIGLMETYSQTYSGSGTGARYFSGYNSVLFTNGGGANYYPGNSAGSVASGLYI
jgi:hypothetical protein